eukprot:415326_1
MYEHFMWTRCMHPYRMAPNVSLLYHAIHMDPSAKAFPIMYPLHSIVISSVVNHPHHPSSIHLMRPRHTHPSETPTTTHAPTQSPVTRSPTRTGQTYPPTTVCRYTLYTKTRHKGTVYTRDAYDSTYTEQLYATTTRYITSDRSIGLTRGRRDSG